MARKVSDVFIETLAAAGVKRVYGVVGDSLNALTEAYLSTACLNCLRR